jgi:predicted dehydrogenase
MKAGIVGAGPMGKVHLRVYQGIKNVTRISMCDIDQGVLDKINEEFPTVILYNDFQEMLDKEDLDIVNIVTTGPSHAKLVIQAAENGVKRIFCEKPISTSVASARGMIKAAAENNSILAINHSRRWYEPYNQLRKTISLGKIGEIKTIHMVLGGGRLGSMGTHLFDLMRMISSKNATGVIGFVDKRYEGDHKGRNIYDPGGHALIFLQDDIKAFIDISEDLGLPLQTMITGSMGYITINEKKQICEIFARSDEDKLKRLGQYGLPLYKSEFPFPELVDLPTLAKKAIIELLEDKQPSCTGEDGLAALEITLAIHLSDKNNNTKIQLPLQDTEFDIKIT